MSSNDSPDRTVRLNPVLNTALIRNIKLNKIRNGENTKHERIMQAR